MPTNPLLCDGCGQPSSPGHIARRLQRLEWTTRYRPVHIGTLLLGASSSQSDTEFLYAGKFEGEAGRLLAATGITHAGKTPEAVLAGFQRGGFFLAHVLECPLDDAAAGSDSLNALLEARIGPVMARIRRSLKPKRMVLFSREVTHITARLSAEELGCQLILDDGKPFDLEADVPGGSWERLREVLSGAATAR